MELGVRSLADSSRALVSGLKLAGGAFENELAAENTSHTITYSVQSTVKSAVERPQRKQKAVSGLYSGLNLASELTHYGCDGYDTMGTMGRRKTPFLPLLWKTLRWLSR